MYFPTDQGTIDLSGEDFHPFSSIDVEGTPVSAVQPAVTLRATPQHSSPSTSSYSGFQSVVHQTRKGNAGGFSLKVIQAHITHITSRGRPDFQLQGQTFIEVCEKTANVMYILTQVQRVFGSEYVVVTADGLEVKDSSGTQGMSEKKLTALYKTLLVDDSCFKCLL